MHCNSDKLLEISARDCISQLITEKYHELEHVWSDDLEAMTYNADGLDYLYLMLPPKLKPIGDDSWEKETWESYRSRLEIPDDEAVRQFYRQVVYDHFDHFNDYYPEFETDDYHYSIQNMTAADAAERIRFFGNHEMKMWSLQFDEFERKNYSYPVFRAMAESGTAPFPPVLIDAGNLRHEHYSYGKPLHLIEGTHRVSYLIRMLERELILPNSVHSFVVLEPNTKDY